MANPFWTQLFPANGTGVRRHDMAWNSVRSILMEVGGDDVQQIVQQWDGSDWSDTPYDPPLPLADTFSARTFAYDPILGQAVSFGGNIGISGTTNADTWVCDDGDGTWRQVTPATSPPNRHAAGMAFCAALGQVVLYGGSTLGGDSPAFHTYTDMWAWDGSTWTDITPGTVPPASINGAINAMVEYGDDVFLFRGNFSGSDASVWTSSGADWTEHVPTTDPPVDVQNCAWDPLHERVVLLGFRGTTGDTDVTYAWPLGGSDWEQIVTDVSPPTLPNHSNFAIGWDGNLGKILMFGGNSSDGTTNPETWVLDIPVPPVEGAINSLFGLGR